MISDVDAILEDCLERIGQGETLQACLERYPEQAAELKLLLGAVSKLDEVQKEIRPSAAFRARTRSQLYAHMDTHPRKNPQPWKGLLLAPRFAFGLAIFLLLVFTFTGTAFAQSSLPGTTLYPWKLKTEQLWRAVSPDPLGVDLAMIDRRVDEIEAVAGDETARAIGMEEYQNVLNDLGKYQDPAAQSRIQPVVAMGEKRLKIAGGIQPVNQVTPTAPATITIPTSTPVPISTQKTSPIPKETIIPSTLIPTELPTGLLPTKRPILTNIPTIPRLSTVVPTLLQPISTAVPTKLSLKTILPPLSSLIPPLQTIIPGIP